MYATNTQDTERQSETPFSPFLSTAQSTNNLILTAYVVGDLGCSPSWP